MSTRPGHDLSELIRWSTRDEWRPHVDAVMAEHFEPAMDAFGMTFGAIGDALGRTWDRVLWGCAFEDALSRRFGPDDANPVEAYLKRRGWKESVATRASMAALQSSVMSLYEVSDIVPGHSLRARDLIRGGEPVLVTERSATQTLTLWDRIAARIVRQRDDAILTGGLLAFTLEGSQQLLAQLRERGGSPGGRQGGSRRRGEARDGALEGWRGSDDDLRQAAPLFTTAWLADVLPRALRTEPPTLFNSDGHEVVFHTVTFPLAPHAVPSEIEHRLTAIGQFRQENPTFWNWIGKAPPRRTRPKGERAIIWDVSMHDGAVVLGNVELKGRVLTLSVSSADRAERGSALLTAALDGLVGQPLTETQTVAQMRAAPPPRHNQPETAPSADIETGVEEEGLVHDMLDRQYRALLGEPVPMLGDVSPRAAARSARGRKTLAVWLKHLENQSRQSHPPHGSHPSHGLHPGGRRPDPMATYDFTWLWQELRIEHLRT